MGHPDNGEQQDNTIEKSISFTLRGCGVGCALILVAIAFAIITWGVKL